MTAEATCRDARLACDVGGERQHIGMAPVPRRVSTGGKLDPLAREARDRERLWTPAMPERFFEDFEPVDASTARVLWAAWCVPRRYRLAPRLWRQEARLPSELVLRTKLRRLEASGLLQVADVTGPGLVFDGQHWSLAGHDRQGRFLALRLTAGGDVRVRRALAQLD